MSRVILKWRMHKLIKLIVATLLNKYDFFMVIEGGTGIGKSTLAFHIGTGVAQEFRRLFKLKEDAVEYYYERVGKKAGLTEEEFITKILKLKEEKRYKFNPQQALVYTQDDLQKFLAGWQGISIPDEMINITFNRDFYSEKQKDIIKMINMFRDHENLTIACVPQFQNLDNQIKNLTKMKITVRKRGVAILHTPNAVVYSKDKWDQATNEKIEKDWIMKKINRPNYSKLTTFRGLIRFPPLSRKQEALYQQIKNEKRNVVLKDEMHLQLEKKDDPINKFLERLIKGSVRSAVEVEGYALALGMPTQTLLNKLSSELKKQGKAHQLSLYYWQGKRISNKNKEIDVLAVDSIVS